MIVKRVLVCGGRDYQDRNKVFNTLYDLADEFGCWTPEDEYGNKLPRLWIIHGGASGADMWADEFAIVNWCPLAEFKADWDKYGKAAGPIRNKQMIDEGQPDIVVAFPGGRGTANMIKQSKERGIEVRIVE